MLSSTTTSSSPEQVVTSPRTSATPSLSPPIPRNESAPPDSFTISKAALQVAHVPCSLYIASRVAQTETSPSLSRFAPFEESYESMNDLRRALKALSVQKKAPYYMQHSSPQRMEARCPSWRHRRHHMDIIRGSEEDTEASPSICDFVVSANRHANGRVYVTRAVITHSSTCSVVHARLAANQMESEAGVETGDTEHAAATVTASALMETALPFMGQLATTRGSREAVKPKDVSDIMKEKFGVKPSYMTAWRALSTFRKQRKDEDSLSYMKLQAYLQAFAETNVGSLVAFEHQEHVPVAPPADLETKLFARAFLCPKALHDALRYCRGSMLLSVFLVTSAFGGVVFMATAQDAVGDNVPVAIGLALVETETEWRFFLEQLQQAFPDLKRYVTSLVHNRGDLLSRAIHCVFPSYSQSDKVDTFIRTTRPDVDAASMPLSSTSISPEMGSSTSALDSSMKWMEALCNKVPLMILVSWVSQVAQMLFQRYERYGHLGSEYPADYHSIAAEYESQSFRYDVVRTSESEFEIIDQQTSAGRVVNFAKQSCTCGEYDVSRFPCLHVFFAVNHAGMRQTDVIPRIFLMTSLKTLYAGRITPIDISNVPSDGVTTPQPLPKKRGRPRKVHQIQQAGGPKVEKLSCSLCGIKGHNKRTCKRATTIPVPVAHAAGDCEMQTGDLANAQDEALFLESSYGDAVTFDNRALEDDGLHSRDSDSRTLYSSSVKRRRLTGYDGAVETNDDGNEDGETSGVALV